MWKYSRQSFSTWTIHFYFESIILFTLKFFLFIFRNCMSHYLLRWGHHWPLAGNIYMQFCNNDPWQESLKAMNFSWKKWWRYIIYTSWNYWMILLLKPRMNEHYRYWYYSSKVTFSQNIVLKFWWAPLKLPKNCISKSIYTHNLKFNNNVFSSSNFSLQIISFLQFKTALIKSHFSNVY